MPGTVIGTSMNQGYPGTYARNGDCYIKSRKIKSTDTNGPSFGDPCVLNADDTYSSVADLLLAGGSFSMANFAGIAGREVKTYLSYPPSNSLGGYEPGDEADVIERGNTPVVCNVGTPTSGGKAYVRIKANVLVAAGVVGGFEAANGVDSTDTEYCIELTNCRWESTLVDGNNVAELAILSRNQA